MDRTFISASVAALWLVTLLPGCPFVAGYEVEDDERSGLEAISPDSGLPDSAAIHSEDPSPPSSGGDAAEPIADSGHAGQAPSATCPDVCSGGCDAQTGQCVIRCDSKQECKEAALVCPPAWPCKLDCRAPQACEKVNFDCGASTSCDIRCADEQSCKGARLSCGDGPCRLDCLDEDSCEDSVMECGAGRCESKCGNDAAWTVCDSSCLCGED